MLGLDIGGAGIKAADGDGMRASARKFALWKNPNGLASELRPLAALYQPERVAVTMTGELCDCFATKADGVASILNSVAKVFPSACVSVWTTEGRFVSIDDARQDPWSVAASNWQALATLACQWTQGYHCLLIDTGSTTTDVIPLRDGRPVAKGKSDPERLATGELVYTGVERTPLCALLHEATVAGIRYSTMAEFFANTLDAYLVLDLLPEDPSETGTADGRPATKEFAAARLARMIGSDSSRFTLENARELAEQVRDRQLHLIQQAANRVVKESLDGTVEMLITSGQGEFLLNALLESPPFRQCKRISFSQQLSREASTAACAYAVARLLGGS